MRKILIKLIAWARGTFVADCPACHSHFFGFDKYAVQTKINNKHYRIVCHRCAGDHVKLIKTG